MKNRTLISLSLSLFFVLPLFTSCDKGDDPPAKSIKDPIVHLAGSSEENGTEKAAHWKNGIKTILQPNGSSYATSIKIKGADLYIGGIDFTSAPEKALLWKNNGPASVIDGDVKNDLVLIDFSGVDLHIMCRQNNNQSFVHYKNGTKVTNTSGVLLGMSVSNNDIYACGSNSSGNPVIWKNGNEILLNEPQMVGSTNVSHMVSNGADVFVCGYLFKENKYDLIYWKNNVPKVYTEVNNSIPEKIFVSGNDVYIAGSTFETGSVISHATYWKNGEKIVLDNSDMSSVIFDIAVSKSGKVYAIGAKQGKAILWIDGKIDAEINGTKDYYIKSIFLEEEK